MNYIEELFSRQGALLRALSNTGSRRLAEESREGERSPSPASELWELVEEEDVRREAERLPAERKRSRAAGAPEPAAAPGAREETGEETGEAVRYETRFREERAGAAETVREFSRLCEQDARRYDGGFPFY